MSMTSNHAKPLAWENHAIVPFENIRIAGSDRTFEHGLGLFESMRGVNGNVPLWDYHLERLIHSARDLDLPISENFIPSAEELSELLITCGLSNGNARLRLVLTGGDVKQNCRLFVTAHKLQETKADGLVLADSCWPVDPRDRLIRYKTLNYWLRRSAYEQAVKEGADEILSEDFEGLHWECSRSSLFLAVGHKLIAPIENGPFLKSVSADALNVIIKKNNLPQPSRELITTDVLLAANEVIITNAVRGIMSARSWRTARYQSPGPMTIQLRTLWQKSFWE